jgi:sigma-E factor negative regulatory protein RseB
MKWVVLCCGVLCSQTQTYAAEPASQAWLKTMAFAKHQTDYSGVFVYEDGKRVEKTKITHLVTADGEYEKLEVLDGSKHEIIRHHGTTWWYSNHQLQQETDPKRGHFPVLQLDQLTALTKNYQMKAAGHEKVAGVESQILLFTPNDKLRYTQKMWVHSDSGLLLKYAVLNEKNQLVEQYAFSQLSIGGNIDRSWINAQSKSLPTFLAAPKETPIKSGWVVDALPAGFNKTKEIQRMMAKKHAPVIQIVFSDGLSAISVFIEPSDADEDDFENLSNRGAVQLYHKVVNKHLFTVVGEVPAKTVIKVLDSIRYNGK